ncbi:SAM-dependent methyltransferase [Variovorax boronicumulans]|uniref:DNA methyltransferase n=1 Tax=Variovorax boronicumulans TaxID=436515 RepID=UPI002786C7B2|nr:DNA methyltransferase [Variovorax boronicumulans]MDQ0081798.1 SAM-dependent methyltransferase [Variovorax boronicumulans]
MPSHSWLMLDHESPLHRLPDDLRARDPLGARDCGWVEQMTPFVRQFSQRGDTVFDPFAGFGTTLLAARLENRLAAGCEIDADRIQLIRERLTRHGIGDSDITLLHGSCDTLDTTALQPFELCLTNVPYFGCQWSGASTASQLYDSRSYAQHLEGLRNVFHAVRTRLREGGHCIAMVQNIRLGDRVLPLAFDLARILGALFTMEEERVLIYPHEEKATADSEACAARTDRRHEYALVFRKQRARIDLEGTARLLDALRAQGHVFTLIGSFARWLHDPQGTPPADADIRVAPDPQRLDALLHELRNQGFALTSWDEPVALPLHFESYRGRYYFRAERIDSAGAMMRLDIGYEE